MLDVVVKRALQFISPTNNEVSEMSEFDYGIVADFLSENFASFVAHVGKFEDGDAELVADSIIEALEMEAGRK